MADEIGESIGITDDGSRKRREIIRYSGNLWPNGVVYYTIDNGTFSFDPTFLDTIDLVVQNYRDRTCLTFTYFDINDGPPSEAGAYILVVGEESGGGYVRTIST